MSATEPTCANCASDDPPCKKTGRFACKNCLLVAYCGAECQKAHWHVHKRDCASPLGKQTWQPGWVSENRAPAFVTDGPSQIPFGRGKYLWGNVPAYDLLNLADNEGVSHDEVLSLFFAGRCHDLIYVVESNMLMDLVYKASGDFRNVVKTIAQLPKSYNQPIRVTMNDWDFDIVARNAILLLVALLVSDASQAADCIIHVWYSALIRESDLEILHRQVQPLIQDVCEKIKNKPLNSLQAKTWKLGDRSVRLVLQKSLWDDLLAFFTVPLGLTADQANEIRRAITICEARRDFRDRSLIFQTQSHRIAMTRFWEDGLLLPFGARRVDFRHPNPTLFQHADNWPLFDSAQPLTGWAAQDVQDTIAGPAKNDIYGKLFCHLRSILRTFIHRVGHSEVSFQLFHMDAEALGKHLTGVAFDRIEVSNIADVGYLGNLRTLDAMVPLLQAPAANPHATLVTLFMNAVDENLAEKEKTADIMSRGPTLGRLLKYLNFPARLKMSGPHDPVVLKLLIARDAVVNHDETFDRHAKKFMFSEVADVVGAGLKSKHSVIEKWPFRLKLQPGQPGAQEEFDRLLSAGISSKECYLEWKKL